MAKNNMDILLGNILGSAAISPDNKTVEQTPETKPIPKQEKRSVKAERKEQTGQFLAAFLLYLLQGTCR